MTPRRLPLLLLLALLTVLGGLTACRPEPELLDIATVPPFAFVDQSGAPIGSETLAGRPYAVNFLFTSCPTACPPLARATADLQTRVEAWAGDGQPWPVQLVSVTIDPATDTPERLTAYGQQYGADFTLWRFARGDYPEMEALVTEGFLQPLIRKDLLEVHDAIKRKALMDQPIPVGTAHSVRFVLVDAQGHIRGTYEKDDASLDQLSRDLQRLAASQ